MGQDLRLRGAVVLAASGVVGLAVATWLGATAGPPHAHQWLYFAWQWVVVLTLEVIGLRVVQSRPGHPIGWILVAMGFIGGVTDFAEMWAYAGLVWRPGHYPGATAADAINTGSWVSAFAGLAFLLLFFPDGRVPSRRWRAVPWALGIATIGMWIGSSVKPGVQQTPFTSIRNPVGVAWTGHLPGILLVVACAITVAGCLIASALSVRTRFRRANEEERAQLFWLAYAGVLVPGALLGCLVGLYFTGTDVVGDVVLPFALILVPGSIGLAVLRYRLYDIEYLVGRTIVYAVSTAVVFLVFVVTALLLGVVVGRTSPIAVATATLGAALLARPVRNRAQRWVNRRFDRDVAEGIALIDAFDAMVREGRADPVAIEVALAQALRDRSVGVRYWLPRQQRFVNGLGAAVEEQHRPSTPVRRGETLLAMIDHAPELLARHRLMSAVLERSLLGIEMARLSAESAVQKAEVEASRARIIEATHEERRRLERDLHDGAQQRLVALGIRVRRLQGVVDDAMATELDGTVDEIAETIKDLRRLAAGVRPARLDDGLLPALEDLVRTTPIPVVLAVDSARLPAALETSAYFVACEAVTNAVKHADASRIEVEVARIENELRVRVSDDGIGGATLRPRSGLSGLADRVTAVGGRLVLESLPGSGTTVEAVLPCAS